jgi:hypothetical protein
MENLTRKALPALSPKPFSDMDSSEGMGPFD